MFFYSLEFIMSFNIIHNTYTESNTYTYEVADVSRLFEIDPMWWCRKSPAVSR